MARTNIDIDEEACAAVMRIHHLATKRDAVNFALRRAAVRELTTEEILALEGSGWGDDDGGPADDSGLVLAEETGGEGW
jgi:Arc/MetJ family transcription regulator